MVSVGMVTGRIYTAIDSKDPLNYGHLQDLKNIGVTSIRVEFEDHDGEKNDYVNAYKNIVNWAGQLGISVMGILTMQSMGKSNFLEPKQTRDLNDFDQNFVPRFLNTFTWHVQTYPNVEGWEIWNEPDYEPNFFYGNRSGKYKFLADEFALLCVRVYEIKKRDIGERKIIIGGMIRMDDDILLRSVLDSQPIRNHKQFFRHGANLLPCDAIGIHGYGNTDFPKRSQYGFGNVQNTPDRGTFRDQINFFLNLKTADQHDLIPKTQPIYITEVGFRIGSAREDEQPEQMKYILETLNSYRQFERVYWYDYRDDEPPNTLKSGIRHNPQAGGGIKPSYNTLANFNGKRGIV